jgi:Tfp pilus assembly protein PilP
MSKAKKQPYWLYSIDNGRLTGRVSANTKSEARAEIKKHVGRIPVGMRIVRKDAQ